MARRILTHYDPLTGYVLAGTGNGGPSHKRSPKGDQAAPSLVAPDEDGTRRLVVIAGDAG
ncbi:MAG: hypothetical protein R3D89_13965 [Sphingomonadaceae bacterium]